MKTSKDGVIILDKTKKDFQKFISAVLLVGALFSCQKDDPEPASPAPLIPTPSVQCKVKKQSTSGMGRESATVTYTYDFVFDFTYDERGNQIGKTGTYKYKYSDGTMVASSNSTSNQFDANDYIVRTVVQSSSTNRDGTSSNSTTNIEFTYADNRLVKQDYSTVDNGKPRNFAFSYEYNSEGKLTKTTSTYDNSYAKYEWNGNKVQKMTRVDQYGNTNTPFLEYNNEGRLVKSIETRGGLTDEFRYQYDANGQQVRFERYINSKPSSAYATEYDTKENPSKQLYANYKGHPIVPGTQAEYEYKNNIIKNISYDGDSVTGEWKVGNTTLYTYDYNNKDLPIEVVGQGLDESGMQTSTTRTSYTYQDCQ
jgi:hypothetical protein